MASAEPARWGRRPRRPHLSLLLALAVALSGAAAGCGHGKEAATVSADELSKLVLQPSDMRGYSRFDEGKQVSLDARPGPREDPARFGRKSGWKARYHAAAPSNPAAVVESRADLFSSEGGAKRDLAAYTEQFSKPIPGSGMAVRRLEEPRLGDASLAVEMRQGPAVFFVIAWRKANATASVLVQGRVRSLPFEDALAVARRQARRLDDAAAS